MPTNFRKAKLGHFRGQLFALGQVRSVYSCEIAHDTDPAALLAPDYWWPVNNRLKPFDTIECVYEDGSRVVRLRVMGKDARAERVVVVVETEKLYEAPVLPAGYTYEFVNKGLGWRIMQDGRNSPVRSGFATQLEAALWLTADGAVEPASRAKVKVDGKEVGKTSAPKKTEETAPA